MARLAAERGERCAGKLLPGIRARRPRVPREPAAAALARAVQPPDPVTRIEVTLPPSRLDDLRAAVARHPWISGLTVFEVKAYGRGHAALYRGGEYPVEFEPEVKVEIVVPAPLVPRIVDDLERWARGEQVEGTVVVVPVEQSVRIRTGERGERSL